MWIARDKNGPLLLFYDFPKRHINVDTWHRPNNSMVLYSEDYPQYRSLKWEDEPIEVNICDVTLVEKYEELKDSYDALHMTYLSQVSLYKSLYEEEKKKNLGNVGNEE